jgi:signal transduction histidine kinase
MNHIDDYSIGSIRRRLWLLLLRAFGIVVFLTAVLILFVSAFAIGMNTRHNPFYLSPTAVLLETYYLGHGSWQGVQVVVEERANTAIRVLQPDWQQTILLDNNGRVILDKGLVNNSQTGTIYILKPGEIEHPLYVNGEWVGTLIVQENSSPNPWRLIITMLGPAIVISIFLGILTLIIGLLLMRRMVDPLAEVIAASKAVSQGDLTARVPVRTRHDDLSELSEHFNHMADELERSDLQRRNLLADLAHELRTPITILRGRLEGILDRVYPPDDAHIAPALEETYLLERLVEDLRLLSLAESNQLHFEMKPVRLNEMVETILGLFSAQAEESKISLHLETETNLPDVMLDPQRFQQVIGNLIDNALRYSPEGSSIDISIIHQDNTIKITIADMGSGIPEDELPYVFDRFWRGEKSRARSTGGAGLGLSIARKLIETQNGRITVQNRSPRGLEVSIELPITSTPSVS